MIDIYQPDSDTYVEVLGRRTTNRRLTSQCDDRYLLLSTAALDLVTITGQLVSASRSRRVVPSLGSLLRQLGHLGIEELQKQSYCSIWYTEERFIERGFSTLR